MGNGWAAVSAFVGAREVRERQGWRVVAQVVGRTTVALVTAAFMLAGGHGTPALADSAVGVSTTHGEVVSAKPRTAPSAPRSVKVKPGNARIAVSWAAPSSSGGAARTAYIVQYSTDGQTWKTASKTVKPAATSYTITGLKNGTSYRVRVIAVNAAGKSKPSTVVSAKPRTVPSKTAAKAASAGSGKVKITWTAPSNGGSAITAYVVQRYSGGKWRTVQTVTSSIRTVTISGLTNGTSYRFRVLARNAVGNGAWSAVVSATPKKPASGSNCHSAYTGACVPIASDVDCEGGGGDGPAYVRGPVYVKVRGVDPYKLDRDKDGVACES